MRHKKQTLSEQAIAPWIPVNYRGSNFQGGVSVTFSGVAVASLQFTLDNPYDSMPCEISQTGTTVTLVFKENHGKSVGDSVRVNGVRDDAVSGTHVITAVSEPMLSFETTTGTFSGSGSAVVYSVFDHPDMTAISDNAEAGFQQAPTAVRLNVTSYTDGAVSANYTFVDLP